MPESFGMTDKNGNANFRSVGGSADATALNGRYGLRHLDGTLRLPPAADILAEPVPVWLAALVAIRCQATADGADHSVRWNHVRGRATYTNRGQVTEFIRPLGVAVEGGHTVAVWWCPGETSYTVQVYCPFERCA